MNGEANRIHDAVREPLPGEAVRHHFVRPAVQRRTEHLGEDRHLPLHHRLHDVGDVVLMVSERSFELLERLDRKLKKSALTGFGKSDLTFSPTNDVAGP